MSTLSSGFAHWRKLQNKKLPWFERASVDEFAHGLLRKARQLGFYLVFVWHDANLPQGMERGFHKGGRKMRMISLIALALTASACAVNTGVQPFAGDIYYVSRQGATGASSQSDLRGAAMNEARTFCESRRQPFQLVELIEARPPYILGNFPKAEVRFRCGDPPNAN